MGILDMLLLREPRQPQLTPADLKAIEKAELGVSGTVAYSGRIHTGDPRANLQWEQAFGTPGAAAWGEWEKLVNTDHAAATALEMVAAPLRDAELGVEPGDDDEASTRVADFVRDCLAEWLDPVWPQLVQEVVLGGLTYGHSVHELVWDTRPDERVPGGQALYVAKLAQRLPGSIKSDGWKEDERGELASIVQAGLRGGRWVGDIAIPADKVLLFRWNARGNNWVGLSAFRPVYYLAKVREALVKIVAIGHEREALGVPVAKEGKDSTLSTEERDDIRQFVENLHAHENTGILLPRDVDLSWVFSPAANKGHVLDTWERLGKAIHEQFFSQQIYLGTSGTGSRSVGEVHADAKTQFVLGVKTVLESVLNGVGRRPYTGLVGKLVKANFGEVKRLPKVSLTLKRPEVEVADLASAVPALVGAGALTVTLEDENAFRNRLGLPPIDEEVRAQEQAKKQAQAQAIAASRHNPFGGGKDDGEEGEDDRPDAKPKDEEEDDAPPRKMADAVPAPLRAQWQPRRALLLEEQHVALADIDAFLTKAREDFDQDGRDILTEMVAGALPVIREAMADGDPSELAALLGQKLDTSKLVPYLDAFVERCRREGWKHAAAEYRKQPAGVRRRPLKFAEEEKDDPVPEPDDAPPVDVSGKVRQVMESMSDKLLRRLRARVIDEAQTEAEYIARTGGDPKAIVARVLENVLETRGLKFDAGTVVTHAFSMGREEFAQAHGDEIEAVQLSAILDRSTCEFCRAKDGQQFEYLSPEHIDNVPPLRGCDGGDACRCVAIYVYRKDGLS